MAYKQSQYYIGETEESVRPLADFARAKTDGFEPFTPENQNGVVFYRRANDQGGFDYLPEVEIFYPPKGGIGPPDGFNPSKDRVEGGGTSMELCHSS